MPIINSIAAMSGDLKTWRRHLHQHPELGLDCHETAAFVVDKLMHHTGLHGNRVLYALGKVVVGWRLIHNAAADGGNQRRRIRLDRARQDARLRA